MYPTSKKFSAQGQGQSDDPFKAEVGLGHRVYKNFETPRRAKVNETDLDEKSAELGMQ